MTMTSLNVPELSNLTPAGAPSMVDRITLIMEAFTLPRARLSLEEVTRASGLPRSTTHRILDQLVQAGWASHTGNQYGLGPRALRLGARDIIYEQLRSSSNARLHQLAQTTGLVVHLAALDGAEVYYIDKFGTNVTKVPSAVGGRAPAHCTAAGKAIMARLEPEIVHDMYIAEPFVVPTRRSLPNLTALHQELGRIRHRKGVAVEQGECHASIGCIGIAIRDLSGPVAGISIVAESGAPIERLTPLLVSTARSISERLIMMETTLSQAPSHS